MKTSYFLIFLAIYSFLAGGVMLFNATGALQNYGIQPVDSYHIAIIEFLGLTNIGLGLNAFLFRNANADSARNIFISTAFLTIGSFLKGCYDVMLLGVPANNFFWIDMSFRLLVGLVCVYFVFRSTKTA